MIKTMKKITSKFISAADMTDYPSICNGGSAACGFDRRVYGETYLEAFRYPHEQQDRYLQGGYDLADKLIDKGELHYVHNFHYLDCKGGFAFKYGGTWVCNTCGGARLNDEEWKIKVFKDGDNWFCVGLDFINLQESNNYGFDKDKKKAIENYWKAIKK